MKRRRFAKGVFIYRDFGQPFVNGLWDVFDDSGWMVRFLVDVEWNVSWFVVWQVFTVSQVKCDVDSNLQTVLGENATQFLLRPAEVMPWLHLDRHFYMRYMRYRTFL